ncbi:UNVERIFIED_CONTAM: hypothetical protein Sangu_0158600 [Sesamum angustifolium]|uniref:Uncharacterized protein n=1 Tax=Sesamum angustifolium TaxID=2727405 RepID=A0AAW2RND6_9LAMI
MLSALANSARRWPVELSSSADDPRPVILKDLSFRDLEARMWNSPGHWRPCMMSRSMTWTWSAPSTACWMAWLAVKCENLIKGVMEL